MAQHIISSLLLPHGTIGLVWADLLIFEKKLETQMMLIPLIKC